MALRPVLKLGDPRLLETAAEVTNFDTPELHALIRDMKETMRALDGAGLAAPQIGISERIVVFEVKGDADSDIEKIPFTVLINPEVVPTSDATEEDWEGCLSVPGMHGLVPRYASVRYRGKDQFGAPVDRRVTGFHARLVQHENDHLDGMLYPRRIADLRYFGFTEALFDDADSDEAAE